VALSIGVFHVHFLVHAAGRREVAQPGRVSSLHAQSEARCEECHAVPGEQPDRRCARCHDPSDAPRHTNAFHAMVATPVAPGPGAKPSPAAGAPRDAPGPSCGACHIEHRGRGARLTAVNRAHCAGCHFRTTSEHPELRLVRDRRLEDPGLKFSHEVHVRKVLEARGGTAADTCGACHAPAGPDLEAIAFDRHCASCHAKRGSLVAVDPVPPADVETPQSVTEFRTSGARITKVVVHHRDEWVLRSLERVRALTEAEAVRAERGRLEARLARLRRRLLRLPPPARLSAGALRARDEQIEAELASIDARLRASPTANAAWLEGALAVVADTDDPAEATALRQRAQASGNTTSLPLSPDELEARRAELLGALSVLGEAKPELEARIEDLRRRLLAVAPGDTSRASLERARAQRLVERERLRDEIALREAGLPPGSALPSEEERALRRALARAEARLAQLSPTLPAALAPAALEEKRHTLEALAAPCVTCHELEGGAFVDPAPAQAVLVRARFPHGAHLAHALCGKCHAGVERSRLSSDLALPSMTTCRECHVPGQAREGCLTCHGYHPRAQP
jgi:hypothetical protein